MNEIEDGRERLLGEEVQKAKVNLEDRLKSADWTFDYSDDANTRRKGSAAIDRIYKDIDALAKQDRQTATEVWDQYAPKDQKRPPSLDPHIEAQMQTQAQAQDAAPQADRPKSGPGSTRFMG